MRMYSYLDANAKSIHLLLGNVCIPGQGRSLFGSLMIKTQNEEIIPNKKRYSSNS